MPSVEGIKLPPIESRLDLDRAGREMYALAADLFPICRSVAGPGLRETMRRIGRELPLELHEVPSGTRAFDWTVPREWTCRDAYIKTLAGRRVVDFQTSNLHVLNYSIPIHETLSRAELLRHVYSLPAQPDRIPYRTSYYEENWGFCVSQRQRDALTDEQYEVCIDARHEIGSLSYGECFLPGKSTDEVLFSAHACHPSLANDNLAGIAVAVQLARWLAERPRRYSFRFVFAPGTIGAIVWLSRNEETVKRIRHGLVLALLGRPGPLVYKRTRSGDAEIDQAASHVLATRDGSHRVIDFDPYGYDERQFGSPGFNLNVGRLTRTPNGEYPEYHTDADNLDLIRPETLADSLAGCQSIVELIEKNRIYRSLSPKGEPQLGRRGLYRAIGGQLDAASVERALLWVLNLADGRHSLLQMAQRSGLPFDAVFRAATLLEQHELLQEAP